MLKRSLSLVECLQSQPGPNDWLLSVKWYAPLIRSWRRRGLPLREEADELTRTVRYQQPCQVAQILAPFVAHQRHETRS